MGKKVLVTATNFGTLCKDGKRLLEEHGFEVVENPFGRPLTFAELQQYAPEAVAVIAGVDTWDKSVFAFTKQLKLIARFGVGYDNINLADAKAAGIYVTNAPGINSDAVADLTVGLIIDMLRGITHLNNSARAGQWERFVGFNLQGKRIGLLGFGNIARGVAKKLSGFGVKLAAFDKYPNLQAARELNVEMRDSVAAVMRDAFVVSCHLPSLPETRHAVNKDTLALMPRGGYFVNTSRGALVATEDLIAAVKSGQLAGAATDVYEQEPVTPDNPVLHTPGIITTPHTAAETYETYAKIGLLSAQAVVDCLEGGKTPAHVVNP